MNEADPVFAVVVEVITGVDVVMVVEVEVVVEVEEVVDVEVLVEVEVVVDIVEVVDGAKNVKLGKPWSNSPTLFKPAPRGISNELRTQKQN